MQIYKKFIKKKKRKSKIIITYCKGDNLVGMPCLEVLSNSVFLYSGFPLFQQHKIQGLFQDIQGPS